MNNDMFRMYPKRLDERDGESAIEVPYTPNRAERRAQQKHERSMRRRGQRAYDRAQREVERAADGLTDEEKMRAVKLASKIKGGRS